MVNISRWRQTVRDGIVRCHVGNLRVSGVLARRTIRDAAQRWHRGAESPPSQLWAEYMAGTVMLSAFQKGEERIKLTVRSPTIQEVYVEAMAVGEVRGRIDLDDPNSSMPRLQKGHMQVEKILYGATKPYVTNVEAIGFPEADWQRFYDVSEQVPTIVRIESTMDRDEPQCCGLTIQKMPDSAPHDRQFEMSDLKLQDNFDLDRIDSLADFVDLLNAVIPGADLTETNCRRIPLDFFCRCSKASFSQRLVQLGSEQLSALINDVDESGLNLTCHFCNDTHSFSKADIQSIAK